MPRQITISLVFAMSPCSLSPSVPGPSKYALPVSADRRPGWPVPSGPRSTARSRNVRCTATSLDGTLLHPAIIEIARTRACACCAACFLGMGLARLRSHLSVSQRGLQNLCVPVPRFASLQGSWLDRLGGLSRRWFRDQIGTSRR
ncbi:hypothetical protein B0T18DRAFT_235792 [Schizothecium vesticola]|uniref:Uncharacterized protein n=1 Tax=Schizothecium vesticola TaxID=314040 RepID=A0AA40BPD9_9PEZI|nr:hypothetical protein B0T18DRAFT_235792 [Schizothecium vesticola]